MAFTTKGQKPVVLVWRLLGWCRPPSCKTNKKAIDCIGILLQKGYFTLRKNKQFCPVSFGENYWHLCLILKIDAKMEQNMPISDVLQSMLESILL